jgi:hypothetical protein
MASTGNRVFMLQITNQGPIARASTITAMAMETLIVVSSIDDFLDLFQSFKLGKFLLDLFDLAFAVDISALFIDHPQVVFTITATREHTVTTHREWPLLLLCAYVLALSDISAHINLAS